MIGGLGDLYREVLLDHSKRPRNKGSLGVPPASRGEGNNPLCGDEVTVYVLLEGDTVADVRFEGRGCAICMAAASAMTEKIKGLSRERALEVFDEFHEVLIGEREPSGARLGDLAAFEGVRRFPMRVKCATLPWHALKQALAADQAPGT